MTHFSGLPDPLNYTCPASEFCATKWAHDYDTVYTTYNYPVKSSNVLTDALVADTVAGDVPLKLRLLGLGASPTDSSPFIDSPLHGAILGGNEAAFDLLINHDADIKVLNDSAMVSKKS